MTRTDDTVPGPFGPMTRRSAIGSTLLAGAAFLGTEGYADQQPAATQPAGPRKRYDMKKSINLWAFPYPQKMTLERVPAARQGRRLRRHRAELRPRERPLAQGRRRRSSRRSASMADEIGIAISGLCSFLFWPYPLTSNDADQARAAAWSWPARSPQAAHDLGAENLLVVPGAVHIPWRDRPRAGAQRRLRPAARARPSASCVPTAEKLKVSLNIENIFFNGYLMTPMEMNAFVDSFQQRARAGPLRHRQHHACSSSPSTGSRSSASGSRTSTSRSSPRRGPTTRSRRSARCSTAPPTGRRSWTRSTQTGYRGYLTFEYFHPYPHYPEALIYQTSDSLDRMLGRK